MTDRIDNLKKLTESITGVANAVNFIINAQMQELELHELENVSIAEWAKIDPEKLEELLAEPEPAKKWPQEGDAVFYLEANGIYEESIWNDEAIYLNKLLAQGNIFKTQFEVTKERDRRAVIQELRVLAGDQSWIDWEDHNQMKYYLCCEYSDGVFYAGFKYSSSTIAHCFFKTADDIEKAIVTIGEERLKVLL